MGEPPIGPMLQSLVSCFDDNKAYAVIKYESSSSVYACFRVQKDSRDFLPLKEGVEDSRIFKYEI